MQWVIIVPVKDLAVAKSRIREPWAAHRASLALAFAQDTVSAALGAPGVTAVAVVTNDALVGPELTRIGAEIVSDEPGAGHNPAIAHGARWAGENHPGAGVAALSGDLPALTSADLGAALGEAATYASAFVADSELTGTTLLAAAPGHPLVPAFGPGSADAHRAAGARELAGSWPTLRRDVDTPAHLAQARQLGLGAATALLMSRLDPAVDASG